MVQLKAGEDQELNLGGHRGIFIYVESQETEAGLQVFLTISDKVRILVQPGKIMLTKKKGKANAQG